MSYDSLDDYLSFYRRFAQDRWDNIGPQEYVVILLTVGIVGWYMMRKAARL